MNKKLFESALKMPPNESLRFAELILASLDHEEEEIRQARIKEVNDRIQAVNEGKAKLFDFESLYDAS